MNINIYYDYQTEARGLHTISDVIAAVEENDGLYKRTISEWLPKINTSKICEVACGAGILMHWLKKQGYNNLEGSDISDAQLKLAKAGGLNVYKMDALQDLKNRKEKSLDCLIALDFYEHLTKELFLDFLFEAYRTLDKGGVLILRGPNGGTPFLGRSLYNDITHQFALTPVAFEAVLKMAGFRKVYFKDSTIPSINKFRSLFAPISWLAQFIIRMIVRAAIREEITYLSPSIFLCAMK